MFNCKIYMHAYHIISISFSIFYVSLSSVTNSKKLSFSSFLEYLLSLIEKSMVSLDKRHKCRLCDDAFLNERPEKYTYVTSTTHP